MRCSLLPTLIADSITDLTPQLLQQRGIKLLMLDFDNTIVPYTTNVPTQQMEVWLKKLVESPIQVCVVSNSYKDRVKVFCKHYGLDCITRAKKPFSRGIKACIAKYRLPASACALAGDQIYTDVLGANCAGAQSILVKAINNHNFWLKARHALEIPCIFAARKRKLHDKMSDK